MASRINQPPWLTILFNGSSLLEPNPALFECKSCSFSFVIFFCWLVTDFVVVVVVVSNVREKRGQVIKQMMEEKILKSTALHLAFLVLGASQQDQLITGDGLLWHSLHHMDIVKSSASVGQFFLLSFNRLSFLVESARSALFFLLFLLFFSLFVCIYLVRVWLAGLRTCLASFRNPRVETGSIRVLIWSGSRQLSSVPPHTLLRFLLAYQSRSIAPSIFSYFWWW